MEFNNIDKKDSQFICIDENLIKANNSKMKKPEIKINDTKNDNNHKSNIENLLKIIKSDFISEYTDIEYIGTGSYSNVFKAKCIKTKNYVSVY